MKNYEEMLVSIDKSWYGVKSLTVSEAVELVSDFRASDETLESIYNCFHNSYDVLKAFCVRDNVPSTVYNALLNEHINNTDVFMSYASRPNLTLDEVVAMFDNWNSEYGVYEHPGRLLKTISKKLDPAFMDSEMWFFIAGFCLPSDVEAHDFLSSTAGIITVRGIEEFMSRDMNNNHKLYFMYDYDTYEEYSDQASHVVKLLSSSEHTEADVIGFLNNHLIYPVRVHSCRSEKTSEEAVKHILAQAFIYMSKNYISEDLFSEALESGLKHHKLTAESFRYSLNFLNYNSRSLLLNAVKSGLADGILCELVSEDSESDMAGVPNEWLRRVYSLSLAELDL